MIRILAGVKLMYPRVYLEEICYIIFVEILPRFCYIFWTFYKNIKLICKNDETVILKGFSFELIEKVYLGLEEKASGNLYTPPLNMVKETLFVKKVNFLELSIVTYILKYLNRLDS